MIVTVKDSSENIKSYDNSSRIYSVENANRILKKKMQRSGVFQYLQKSKYFISPSQERTERKNNTMKTIAKYKRNQNKSTISRKVKFTGNSSETRFSR